jgi:hypothetical protein
MKGFLASISACCLLVGIGSMLNGTASTIEVPVSYEIAATTPATMESHTSFDQVSAASGDILASVSRPLAAGRGGCSGDSCSGGQCGVPQQQSVTVTESASAASEEGERRRPVVGAAMGVGKVIRGVLGSERRQARRQARRGG